ncbi:hypothetical protein CEUSTIGMA_g496.t1 [Chlamydomonas eustigma]|uniref:AAA+ ATPase domain-containing protein n=1 Tax=Chlamydomonas eustigma TaxID=1157962 RepID=A0A250WQE9_9CHLO|nr:hypothetical protein CEUSTIGMA_g496.t1 [Chlamydomonas eustigma]|eukprot:GAX73043.1 hypothetical protein CEUSTIGMA_g496.t1 [Chlamydomonas eustigma]
MMTSLIGSPLLDTQARQDDAPCPEDYTPAPTTSEPTPGVLTVDSIVIQLNTLGLREDHPHNEDSEPNLTTKPTIVPHVNREDEQKGNKSTTSRVAGQEEALQALRELIGWPMLYNREGSVLGVNWPRGVLLHGPPGCGKTLLVSSVAEEYGAVLHSITAADVIGSYVGESERRLRELFEAAQADAEAGHAVVVFLDEADALCPKRDGSRQHEARVVAQLLTLLDGADTKTKSPSFPTPAICYTNAAGSQGHGPQGGYLVVIAATNRPNALDPALRRPGRLDREVMVSVPSALGREQILRIHTSGLTLSPDLDLSKVAESCHGYSGADLAALAREAAMHALTASAENVLTGQAWMSDTAQKQMQGASYVAAQQDSATSIGILSAADFAVAMRKVGPSIARGAAVEVSPVRWDEVGGLEEVKRRLQQAVEWPLQHPEAFKRLGLQPPRGVLLYGPPGCSKTSLARAAATASRATLLPLSCAQLFSMYAGEGEGMLRDVFKRARLAAPSIIFLDEVDAVAVKRSESASDTSDSSSLRLLSTLLTEMDGMELATGVLVLAATNRPHAIDTALMRPGRLDVQLYVPPPDTAGRLEVLKVLTKNMPLDREVDLKEISERTQGYSGADLAGLCREAAIYALRENLESASFLARRHFDSAVSAGKPSLTGAILQQYEAWNISRGKNRIN